MNTAVAARNVGAVRREEDRRSDCYALVLWRWGRELFETAAGPPDIVLPSTVVARMEKLLDEALARTAADTPLGGLGRDGRTVWGRVVLKLEGELHSISTYYMLSKENLKCPNKVALLHNLVSLTKTSMLLCVLQKC
jgi:hypothetical protein